MKSLGSRLRRTLGDAPTEPAAPSPELVETLARYHQLRESSRATSNGELGEPLALEAVSEGREVDTPHGPAWVVDTRYPLSHVHGARRLGRFFEAPLEHLPLLTADPRIEGRSARSALFLDIEATGLDHGAGTHAFLIGLGRLDGDEFLVRQLFMRNHACEQAVLHLLTLELERDPLLISFNGKSYDLTVLQTRLRIQRFYSAEECDLKLRPHLDLLHLGRNLYRDCFDDTRLGTLEREILGFTREDDVPGHLVPACWFHYLRTGDAVPVAGVLLHNLHDVVSMVTLAERLAAAAHLGPDPTRAPEVSRNLARVLVRRRAPSLCLDVLAAHPEPQLDVDALHLRAVAARRTGDEELARESLEAVLVRVPDDPAALRALSITCERAALDLPRALTLARRLLIVDDTPLNHRRVDRLLARLDRAAEDSG